MKVVESANEFLITGWYAVYFLVFRAWSANLAGINFYPVVLPIKKRRDLFSPILFRLATSYF